MQRSSPSRMPSIRSRRAGVSLLALAGSVAIAVAMSAPAARAESAALASTATGTILSSTTTSFDVLGLPLDVQAWRITYASEDSQGNSVTDTATLLLPTNYASPEPQRPLLSYQVAEDSLGTECAPSAEMAAGTELEEPLIIAALEQGWAIVVPDYEGPDSQWTAGVQAGHAVLDGIKAAESFAPLGLNGSATHVGLWGYSGGGQATAWAAELTASYAPGLDIVGAAEGGVPVNMADAAKKIDGTAFSGLYWGAAIGLSRAYPNLVNLDNILNPVGQVKADAESSACIEALAVFSAFQPIELYTWWGENPLSNSGVQQAVADDELGQHLPDMPVFNYMAENDEILPFADDAALVSKYCSEGVTVQFLEDPVADHISLAITGAAAAIDYLIGRFAGQPAPDTCSSGPVTQVTVLPTTQQLITELTAITGLTGLI
jgi:hypothetical protein